MSAKIAVFAGLKPCFKGFKMVKKNNIEIAIFSGY